MNDDVVLRLFFAMKSLIKEKLLGIWLMLWAVVATFQVFAMSLEVGNWC
jgi:hypothetical protein